MDSVRFQLLGSVRVVSERPTPLGRQSRTVLAALLLDAGHVVTVSALIDALREVDTAPRSAVGCVHDQIHGLRELLAGPRQESDKDSMIVTRPPGYVFTGDRSHVDLAVFRDQRSEPRFHRPLTDMTLTNIMGLVRCCRRHRGEQER